MTEGFQYWNPVHGDGKSSNGYINNDFRNQLRWNVQNILTFSKTFGGSHNVSAVLVNEFQKQRVNNFFGSGTNLADPFFSSNIVSGSFGTQNSGGGLTENGFISYAGRVNYNYKGKYFVQGSLRRDGISSLPADNRYGLFPGVSAGWTVSKESFMDGIRDVISDFKIRASYARVGNVDIGNYPYLYTYSPAKYADYNGIAFSQAGNENLKWEISTKYDAGFDLLLFDGKYKFTFDYFMNNQDGLILAAPTPPSLGIPLNVINKNIGSMRNWGYELSAEAYIIRNSDFTWSVDGNITFAGNKVDALYNNLDMIYNYTIIRVGESYRAIYGYDYVGVNGANGNPLYRKGDGQIVQANIPTSTYVNYDPNNQANVSIPAGQLGNADKKILGSSLPTYFGAINTKATFKGFDVNVMFRFSGGNMVMNRTRMDLLGQNFTNNSKEILGRWKDVNNTGDGMTPKLWAAGGNFVNLSDQASTRWVEKGNFIKLSTLTLGYTLPKEWLRKLNIESLRVFAQGQDIFMISKYKGIDPEMEIDGADYNGTPRQRVITFGINLGI
jgi:TonB-linked SusC/RagA family outer membrane protein